MPTASPTLPTATVIVQRDAPEGTFDITVALTFNEDFGWRVDDSLDEDGGWISLTPAEGRLAISLAEDGEDLPAERPLWL